MTPNSGSGNAPSAFVEPKLEDVAVGDLVFRTRIAGEGDRLVLLLHGFPQTSWMWRHVLPALAAAGYRVAAPDQRGYSPGARPEDVEEYGFAALTGDVAGLAAALGHDRFDVVGHDWGGAVAWGTAARFPDQVRSVTSVSTPHSAALVEAMGAPSGDQANKSSYMSLFGAEKGKAEAVLLSGGADGLRGVYESWGLGTEDDDDVEAYVRALSDEPTLSAALNWYRRGFEWAAVEPVEVPALYVWGTEDVALGREAAELTEKYVGGPYRFVVLDGVDHWVAEHAGDRLIAELTAHLAAT
ncbi:MAG TPA: alpha/beta hydrolase [Acidimicrobiales bacterium]|nr:alpha/beta hydrolase [Acidimicrobiales bacterium]